MPCRWTIFPVLATLALATSTANAQVGAQDKDRQPSAVDPKACAPQDRLQPDGETPKLPDGAAGETLSDKLARTEGVICPPDVGPDIRLKAPEEGTTPVIPPPGSPDGDPSVRPK